MEFYSTFAEVYDLFMEGTPYSEWVDYLEAIWEKYNLRPGLLLDLGCGTGSVSVELAKRRYEVIGLDLSPEMLEQAAKKAKTAGAEVLLVNQDMRSFELYGTVDSVVSLCDSLNYILSEEELLQVFKCVATYLNPGGVFIFDLNTKFKYEMELADNTFAETFDNAAYIWENSYDPSSGINEYTVDFFVLDGSRGVYKRYEEFHYQKSYELETVSGLLTEAGLEILDVYDAYSFDPPGESSGRVFFVAGSLKKIVS